MCKTSRGAVGSIQGAVLPKNPKSEARNPKQIGSTKSGIRVGRFVGQVANLPENARQVGNLPHKRPTTGIRDNTLLNRTFRIFDFRLIRVCFEFRASDFGFSAKPHGALGLSLRRYASRSRSSAGVLTTPSG